MRLDVIQEARIERPESFDQSGLRRFFNEQSESLFSKEGFKAGFDMDLVANNVKSFAGVTADSSAVSVGSIFDEFLTMYKGTESNSTKTSGLRSISEMKINPDFRYANERQHAGFGAEVISTTKENLKNRMEGTGIKTVRTDDLPDLYGRNNPLIDKVRIDQNGKIIDQIQVKFIGKDGHDCAHKLMGKKYDKYVENPEVTKIEIPKDHYIGAKASLKEQLEKDQISLERCRELGKTEAAQKLEHKIARNSLLDSKLEQSNTASDEALFAIKHPKTYTSSLFVGNAVRAGLDGGLASAKIAAMLSGTVSLCSNMKDVLDGSKELPEALMDSAKETALGAGAAGAFGFASSTAQYLFCQSSSTLFQALGNAGLPAAAVSLAATSYDSFSAYAHGEISLEEMGIQLGENAAGMFGSMGGMALAGMIAGAVFTGGTGPILLGLAGGLAGTVAATELYSLVCDYGLEAAEAAGSQIQELAGQTMDAIKEGLPKAASQVQDAINQFFSANSLPFRI